MIGNVQYQRMQTNYFIKFEYCKSSTIAIVYVGMPFAKINKKMILTDTGRLVQMNPPSDA